MHHFKKRKIRKAITLIELVIVLIIVGLLATLAVPMLTKTVETSRAKVALSALEQIRSGERIYRTGQNFFYPYNDSVDDIAQINADLRVFLDERTSRDWDYSVSGSAASFSATAKRTSGKNEDETITIDQDGNIGGSWSP